jgi:tetratricopeptide (TPR) repeat protein
MRNIKFIFFFLVIAIYSCEQSSNHKNDAEVARLSNKIIPLIPFTSNPDSCRKALLFLDSATAIDNNCFLCHYNKLMFLFGLKQYDKAIKTVDELLKLHPDEQYLIMIQGGLYERIGDTISSKKCFQKSLVICNKVLDTMSKTNNDYIMFVTDKAVNMIMLGDSTKANTILQTLYDNQPEDSVFDNADKKFILSFMHKSKTELLQIEQDTSESFSYPDAN